VSYKTACEILNEPYVVRFEKIYDSIKTRLGEYGLELCSYEDDVWILGTAIRELTLHTNKYMNLDDVLEILKFYKTKVSNGLKMVGADLSMFDIQMTPGEPIKVYKPKPFIIIKS